MYEYDAEITSVYDGDTVTATIDLGFNLFTKGAKLRLVGIDTAEMRGGSAAEKTAAVAARDHVRERVLGKKVRMQSKKKGKYGRYLAVLWPLDKDGLPQEESLNDELLRLNLAELY